MNRFFNLRKCEICKCCDNRKEVVVLGDPLHFKFAHHRCAFGVVVNPKKIFTRDLRINL
jgi:hypothetical protein